MSPSSTLSSLRRLMSRDDWPVLALLLVFGVLEALVELAGVGAVPAVLALLFGSGLTERAAGSLPGTVAPQGMSSMAALMILAVGALFIARSLVSIAVSQFQHRIVRSRQIALEKKVFELLLRAPLYYHTAHHSAEFTRKLQHDIPYAFGGMINQILSFCRSLLILILILGCLLWIDPVVTLIVVTPLLLAGACLVLWQRRRAASLSAHGKAERTAQIVNIRNGLGALKEARLLGAGSEFVDRLAENSTRLAAIQRREMFGAGLPANMMELAGVLVLLGVAAVLLNRGDTGGTIASLIGLYTIALIRLKTALSTTLTSFGQMQSRQPALAELAADVAHLERIAEPPFGANRLAFNRTIFFEGLAFRHQGAESAVLTDVSLSINRGEMIGIMGSSGAGKSTLLDIMLGLQPPAQGRILLDGADVSADRIAWQAQCAYLPQSVFIFDDTVRRNVALGSRDGEIDDARVWQALEQAGAASFVRALPTGLATKVGEAGARLSGGELQRLGLARALYAQRPFLVIDEGTSALDEATEAQVLEGLVARHDMAIVIVSHRTSTLKHCSSVYQLSEGVLVPVASGAHPSGPSTVKAVARPCCAPAMANPHLAALDRWLQSPYAPLLLPCVPRTADLSHWPRSERPSAGKSPGVLGRDQRWQPIDLTTYEPCRDDLEQSLRLGGGLAIRTARPLAALGDASLFGLDIDVEAPELASLLVDEAFRILGPAPRRFGSRPRVMLIYRAQWTAKTRNLDIVFNAPQAEATYAKVDLLSQGLRFMVEGPHKKSGQPYTWGQAPLWDIDPKSIPLVSQRDLEHFLNRVGALLAQRQGEFGYNLELAEKIYWLKWHVFPFVPPLGLQSRLPQHWFKKRYYAPSDGKADKARTINSDGGSSVVPHLAPVTEAVPMLPCLPQQVPQAPGLGASAGG